MIVDDSPIDRKVIRHIIETKLENVKVFEAEDGLYLKEKLVVNNIHMYILDIVMPNKDGFEVLLEMKVDAAVMNVPVIVCTGIENKQAIERALRLGAYDYFSKPFSEEVMKISLPLKVKNAIELTKTNEGISYLSYHDVLTGLYNRRFYEEEIQKVDVEKNLPISIVMGDINGLKLVNDAFGHGTGDKLLKVAADSIQAMCRRNDIIARWGGDEFVILLPKTEKIVAEEIVKKIKRLYKDKEINGIEGSISFGWDTKDNLDQDIIKILKNAEDDMYRTKTLENESIRSNMISTIVKTLHEKNPREEKHSKRVSELCEAIGMASDLSEIEVRKLRLGGLLHDIGKIAIEEGILNKPGRLTDQEWIEIKRHPEIGYRILSSSHEMLELTEGILSHHEKWDGTGYPKGLKGEEIPKVARIIAVADSYDAMTSERSYRTALSEDVVLEEIRKNAGTHFDPKVVKIFIEKVVSKGHYMRKC